MNIHYRYCNYCHYMMEKLTRSYFLFNTKKGAYPTCLGRGKILDINLNKVLNLNLLFCNSVVIFWHHHYKEYQIKQLEKVYHELDI